MLLTTPKPELDNWKKRWNGKYSHPLSNISRRAECKQTNQIANNYISDDVKSTVELFTNVNISSKSYVVWDFFSNLTFISLNKIFLQRGQYRQQVHDN